MDFKEAIDDLLHVLDLHRHDYAQEDYIKESFHMAIEAFERTPWIPVTERLPDVSETLCGYVLVWSNELEEPQVEKYWTIDSEGTDYTHWMPLPKQPEVE